MNLYRPDFPFLARIFYFLSVDQSFPCTLFFHINELRKKAEKYVKNVQD